MAAATNLKIGKYTFADLRDFPLQELLGPAKAVFPLTPGTTFAKGIPKALWIGTAGTLNFTDYEGNVITGFPAPAGRLDILVQSIQTGGSATDIFGLY